MSFSTSKGGFKISDTEFFGLIVSVIKWSWKLPYRQIFKEIQWRAQNSCYFEIIISEIDEDQENFLNSIFLASTEASRVPSFD